MPPQGVTPFEFRRNLWRQKTEVPIMWHYLRNPMFTLLIQYRSVTDTHTDRHMTTAYTMLA